MSEESGKVCLFKRAKKPQRGRGQRRRHESSDSNKSSASSDAGSDRGTNILISRNFFCQFSWILEMRTAHSVYHLDDEDEEKWSD